MDLYLNKDVLTESEFNGMCIQYAWNRKYHSQVMKLSKELFEKINRNQNVQIPMENENEYMLKIYDPFCAFKGYRRSNQMPKKCFQHFATENIKHIV